MNSVRPRLRIHPIMGLTGLAIIVAMCTFLGISGKLPLPFDLSAQRIWQMLLLNITLMMTLAALIATKVSHHWKNLQQTFFKSNLQRRIVLSFTLITILPTVLVSLFSIMFFNLGIQAWFNDRVNTAVEESLAVAEAYLNEHRDNIRIDAIGLAAELSHFSDMALSNPLEFNRLVSAQASRRQLTEVVVFRRNHIIAQGRLSFTLAFESLPQDAIERAAAGDVVILQSNDEDGDNEKVRALAKIESLDDTYLLVGRLVDDKVINHMQKTQGAVNEYHSLKSQLSRLQWAFSLLFLSLTLVLLMAAAWYGLTFSSRLTTPVIALASVAERVRAGDYTGRVPVATEDDEVSTLARTFNRMVEQLEMQRGELIEANRELDERRRFSEAVLGGVSAGVLALDAAKRVTLSNRSAASILASSAEEFAGRHISEILPGINELLVQAEAVKGETIQGSLTVEQGAVAHTLHVRVTVEYNQQGIEGYIVTFDDITPLVAAQRNAAWSDVARRVAHEIKNPLTPIALSAERIRRKYAKFIEESELDTFTKYLDTIGRHVTDIGRMVEEFVSFARMPGAVMHEVDLVQIVKKSVFSEQVAHPTIQYQFTSEVPKIPFKCDDRQLSQVLTNLLKNAAEAIEGAQLEDTQGAPHDGIQITMSLPGDQILLEIRDNGPGFPPDRISALTEPYVTTRSKGTGLGLAIVKKIVEEHGGTLELSNHPAGGARVLLSFLQQCDIKAANSAEEHA